MKESIAELQSTLKQKQQVLDHAKQTLKSEFVGIDTVIDKIFEWIGPWFLFPNMQEKPLVINLWGMTGVGKSSLVSRLVELLGFSNRYYRYDMGEISQDSNMNVKDQLKDLTAKKEPEPFIISFDEFQHARTIDEDNKEIQKPDSRIVWKILDNGQFDIDLAHFMDIRKLTRLISKIEYSVNIGVKAENGRVTEKKKLHYRNYHFLELMNADKEEEEELEEKFYNQEVLLIEKYEYSTIYTCAPELFQERLSVEKKFKSMNEKETLTFLKKCLEVTMQPTTIDCSLSLIFVIGNLDEAYKMSSEFSPELSADEFHRISKEININTIKNALKSRFRSEQIARLGNNHIIYPALSSDSYRRIIQLELNRISSKVENEQGIKLSFEKSVINLIYNEGVYPTQGTRPVFSTIHQIINTKLSTIFSSVFLHGLEPDELKLQYKDKIMIISCLKEGNILDQFELPQHLELGELQKERKDDLQAITAVHESGHAVLSTVLMKSVPKVIYSILSDSDKHGFTYSSYKWNYISKKEILPRVAVMLGGYAAEIAIFGEEYLTAGANTDINAATEFLSVMIKRNGMGSLPIQYAISNMEENAYHHADEIEEMIRSMIEKGLELATKTLKKEKAFLLALADYLSDNRMIKQEEIKAIYQKTASQQIELIEKGDHLFYRDRLKEQIYDSKNETQNTETFEEVSLNKNSEHASNG